MRTQLFAGLTIIIVGTYLIFEIMTSLGFVWSSENLTPEQIPAFETASVVVLIISIGMLPLGGILIGKSKKTRKKIQSFPKNNSTRIKSSKPRFLTKNKKW